MFMRILMLIFCFSFCQLSLNGQGFFKGSIVLGFNAAQLDGDLLAGYNHVGLTGGLKMGIPLKDRLDLNMEMVFSQKGSASRIIRGQAGVQRRTTLNYFEMPIHVSFSDWFIEDEDYYKVSVHSGFSAGYLVGVSSTDTSLGSDDLGGYKKYDLQWLAGFSYDFNRHWGLTVRYTTSMIRIFTPPNTDFTALRSYFLTFRSEYKF